MTDDTSTELHGMGELVSRLTKEAHGRAELIHVETDRGVLPILIRSPEVVAEILPQLAARPMHLEQHVTVREVDALARYWSRHAEAHSLMFADADPDTGQIAFTGVFDYHTTGPGSEPGWCKHRVTLEVRPTADFAAWAGLHGKFIEQEVFADFLLDHVHNVRSVTEDGGGETYSGADLLQAARNFHVNVNANCTSVVRTQDGAINFAYQEEIEQRPRRDVVRLPDRFNVRLAVFDGMPEEDIMVAVRFKHARGGRPQFRCDLRRPDLVVRKQFALVRESVENFVGADHFIAGRAP